ncbi:hypothetical protein BD289DRAFT_137244 [Coniella lustricola]|uniref:NADP-dependent oxidoreductase domain-containing protein n=1 Tax=Coniella lustricola TaxID=2025994 RepID=A0A2T2ZVN0_9PEZI|nr:hypothetical protein BD289DRAFT_137244 [Coniella lustricola]
MLANWMLPFHQFSLLDARPLQRMTDVCEKYGLKLLTYGSFCGGFISPKWLNQPVPEIYSEASQLTPSQRKYFDMLQNWGSWTDFQHLLSTLAAIADKHNSSQHHHTCPTAAATKITLTNIATRWILQQPSVGAVIVGTRLGVSTHAQDNLNVFRFALDEEDVQRINAVALGAASGGAGAKDAWTRANRVFGILGDCGNEYRAMH